MSTVNPAPLPAARLATDTLPLSRMQRLVLEAVRSFERGAKAAEIAEQLGMHINTVRGHLDELIELQAVVTERARSRGRGRPSVLFHARIPSGSAVLTEHAALIQALVEHLGDPRDPHTQQTARDIGRDWAQRIQRAGTSWSSPEDAVRVLTRALRRLGFDPGMRVTEDDYAVIDVHACPFASDEGAAPNPLVCAIHEGFLGEALGPFQQGQAHIQLLPMAKPNCCQVVLQAHCAEDER